MMDILYVVPYVPNLIRVRPYNLIRHLSERGHRLTVLTLWSDEQERASLEDLRHMVHQVQAVHLPAWRSLVNCLIALPSRTPLQAVYSWDAALAEQIGQLTWQGNSHSPFDVVHVEHLRGVRYALDLKPRLKGRHPRLPIVWDSVDSISLLFRQAMVRSTSRFSRELTRFELGRTERYEGWLIDQFDRVLVTSPLDKAALASLAPPGGERITVLPNGVDLDYFKPHAGLPREPATLVISGKMSYHANVTMALHFVQDILPLIWLENPDVKVCIVGKDPPASLQSLAEDPRVLVTGIVDDLRSYLQRATLAVAPIRYGTGIQNKVLEAMACGTPVVTTYQAVSALQAVPDQDLILADHPYEFAQAVLGLLNDPEKRLRVSRAGRSYVEKYHDWRKAAADLEGIYLAVSEFAPALA